MFGVGVPELMLILVVGLVVFGPAKLPEIGRALGKTIGEFKKLSNSITVEPIKADPPQRKKTEEAAKAPEDKESAESKAEDSEDKN